MERTSELGIKL